MAKCCTFKEGCKNVEILPKGFFEMNWWKRDGMEFLMMNAEVKIGQILNYQLKSTSFFWIFWKAGFVTDQEGQIIFHMFEAFIKSLDSVSIPLVQIFTKSESLSPSLDSFAHRASLKSTFGTPTLMKLTIVHL